MVSTAERNSCNLAVVFTWDTHLQVVVFLDECDSVHISWTFKTTEWHTWLAHIQECRCFALLLYFVIHGNVALFVARNIAVRVIDLCFILQIIICVVSMAWVSQLGLLLWKNYVLQKRKVLVTILEIALPTIFSFILILIRQRVDAQEHGSPTTWGEFSANHLPGKLCPEQTPLTLLGACDKTWQLYYYPNTSDTVNSILSSVQAQLNQSIHGKCTEMWPWKEWHLRRMWTRSAFTLYVPLPWSVVWTVAFLCCSCEGLQQWISNDLWHCDHLWEKQIHHWLHFGHPGCHCLLRPTCWWPVYWPQRPEYILPDQAELLPSQRRQCWSLLNL